MARRWPRPAMTRRSGFGGRPGTKRPRLNASWPMQNEESPLWRLRFIPHPILCRLHRIIWIVLQCVREVVAGAVAVNEEDRRNKSLPVVFQLVRCDRDRCAREVPMVIVLEPVGRRLKHANKPRRVGHPSLL